MEAATQPKATKAQSAGIKRKRQATDVSEEQGDLEDEEAVLKKVMKESKEEHERQMKRYNYRSYGSDNFGT